MITFEYFFINDFFYKTYKGLVYAFFRTDYLILLKNIELLLESQSALFCFLSNFIILTFLQNNSIYISYFKKKLSRLFKIFQSCWRESSDYCKNIKICWNKTITMFIKINTQVYFTCTTWLWPMKEKKIKLRLDSCLGSIRCSKVCGNVRRRKWKNIAVSRWGTLERWRA